MYVCIWSSGCILRSSVVCVCVREQCGVYKGAKGAVYVYMREQCVRIWSNVLCVY